MTAYDDAKRAEVHIDYTTPDFDPFAVMLTLLPDLPPSEHAGRIIDIPDWLMARATWVETFKEEW